MCSNKSVACRVFHTQFKIISNGSKKIVEQMVSVSYLVAFLVSFQDAVTSRLNWDSGTSPEKLQILRGVIRSIIDGLLLWGAGD